MFALIAEISKKASIPVYLVGGAVRDVIFGLITQETDLDFVVEGNALRFAEELARENGGVFRGFERFLTSKVHLPGAGGDEIGTLDFASCRTESYPSAGRLPEVLPGTLEQDMVRRDFRINAMYVPVIELAARGDLLNRDVVEGLAMGPKGFREDVLNQVVDVFHERSFIDDTTRVFRAYRYRERIRGIFSKSVVSLVTTSVNHQSLIEMEGVRVAGEFSRLLESPNAGAVIDQMIGDGVVESLGILDQEATSLASKLLKALVGVELTPHLQKQVLLQVLWNCFRQSRRQLFSTEEWNQLFGISVKMHNRWVREWAMVESGQIGKQELSIAGKVVFDLYRAV